MNALDAERVVAAIWADLLNRDHVERDDNFFELGGDSVLAIEMISRTKQAVPALRALTPTDAFDHQTVRELVELAAASDGPKLQDSPASGPMPFTPALAGQLLWAPEQLPTHQLLYVIRFGQPVSAELLHRALRHLVTHHDALRLRLRPVGTEWEQVILGESDLDSAEVLTETRVPSASPETLWAVWEVLLSRIDVGSPPLLKGALCSFGDGSPQQLALAIHHWAYDPISIQILLDDLQSAYQQLARGSQVYLPVKTTSYKRWAEKLVSFGSSPAGRAEAGYWQSVVSKPVAGLPRMLPPHLPTSAGPVHMELDAATTRALLHRVLPKCKAHIDEVMLAGVAHAFREVCGKGGLQVSLLHHGRVSCFPGCDVARTVGWFTMEVPVHLDLTGCTGPLDELDVVKRRVRSIPNGGVGFGVLTYVARDPAFQHVRPAQIVVNNVGYPDRAPRQLFEVVDWRGMQRNLDKYIEAGMTLDLQIGVWRDVLRMVWKYPPLYAAATIGELAERSLAALRRLIDAVPG